MNATSVTEDLNNYVKFSGSIVKFKNKQTNKQVSKSRKKLNTITLENIRKHVIPEFVFIFSWHSEALGTQFVFVFRLACSNQFHFKDVNLFRFGRGL